MDDRLKEKSSHNGALNLPEQLGTDSTSLMNCSGGRNTILPPKKFPQLMLSSVSFQELPLVFKWVEVW